MSAEGKKDGVLVKWQLPMQRVLLALAPITAAAVYFFGWRALVLVAVCNLAAFLTELLFLRPRGEPATSAVFVTGTLLALSLPPTLPVWMAAAGAVFGVLFGKMVFGGFGRNPFNPALVGRAFLYIGFAIYMNARWYDPISGPAGGFLAYTSDAVTGATPLRTMAAGAHVPLSTLFLGRTAGSLGETCDPLILAGGLYLIWRKAANYRIVVSGLAAMLALQTALWAAGIPRAVDPLSALFGGSFLFGLFFFATEPVSACQTDAGRWLYGAFIGIMAVLIRVFSAWSGSTMFAVLLGNVFAPITDYGIRALKARSRAGAP